MHLIYETCHIYNYLAPPTTKLIARVLASQAMENSSKNPILQTDNHKQRAFNFPEIKPEHFEPALDECISTAKKAIAKIKGLSEWTFENTIFALEQAQSSVNRVAGLYFNLLNAEATEEIQALAASISPKLSSFGSDISLDEELFNCIKVVYDNRSSADLTTEQMTFLEETYKDFTRNGALLDADKKAQLRNLDQQLSTLSPKFSENLLKATNAYVLFVDNKDDIKNLPELTLAGAKKLAEEKGKPDQWAFTLQYPSYSPFLTYCDNRELRKEITLASLQRAYRGELDNTKNIQKIASLKHQRASLLGYKTHAHYTLEQRMAETPEKVIQFLGELKGHALPAATRELAELTEFAKADGVNTIERWDINYYIEKYKKEKLNFDQEELRPYFKLENVIDGAFEHASRLYGIEFKPTTDYPVYHDDVLTYEVYKKGTTEFVGLFYADFFPRSTKQSGAWMTEYKGQGMYGKDLERPQISIVCNFTPSTESKPSLLTMDEVRTLFHEFGHALHGLLAEGTYKSLSGTNVYWDFVELPSQIMENWTTEKEGLSLFAKHYETGEIIPDELIDKLKSTSQYMAGYYNFRQLELGTLDFAYFNNENPESISDIEAFEAESLKEFTLFPTIKGTTRSCTFSHIFDGGYSAGYYSYKWAEVLDADAFELFKEKGLFNEAVATSFKENVLSKGGTEHPMVLYKRFRGREPNATALLKRDGLIK